MISSSFKWYSLTNLEMVDLFKRCSIKPVQGSVAQGTVWCSGGLDYFYRCVWDVPHYIHVGVGLTNSILSV